jgi:hypothetical protein
MTNVEIRDAGSAQRGDEIWLDWLCQQRELARAYIHKHASLFADDPVGQRKHLGHDLAELLPSPPGDDHQRVTVSPRPTKGLDRLIGDGCAVEERSVDVDGDYHFLHTPSYLDFYAISYQ